MVLATAGPWLAASGAVALLVLAPLAALAVAAAGGSAGLWRHLLAYVLPAAARDTLILLAGVGVVTAVLGTGAAWLVTAYDFPGRRTLDWALLLPLAVPTYIVAYAYLDILHPVGPVQTALRALLGFDSPRQFRLPDVRSMTGCVAAARLRAVSVRLPHDAGDVPDAGREPASTPRARSAQDAARSSSASRCRSRVRRSRSA